MGDSLAKYRAVLATLGPTDRTLHMHPDDWDEVKRRLPPEERASLRDGASFDFRGVRVYLNSALPRGLVLKNLGEGG